MSIQVGATIPEATLRYLTYSEDHTLICGLPAAVKTTEYFKGKKVVLVAVPGAFTPTCSGSHAPGYIQKADELKAKGVDLIVIIAANDHYVMEAWARSLNADGKVQFLADGNNEFSEAVGLTVDISKAGLGKRSARYALIIDNLVVKYVGVDASGLEKSGADAVLAQL